MTARKCWACGDPLPDGKHRPHCPDTECDWYQCPCGKTYDLDKHTCVFPGPLRDETKGQK